MADAWGSASYQQAGGAAYHQQQQYQQYQQQYDQGHHHHQHHQHHHSYSQQYSHQQQYPYQHSSGHSQHSQRGPNDYGYDAHHQQHYAQHYGSAAGGSAGPSSSDAIAAAPASSSDNMAGFGARRFAESSRKQAEEAEARARWQREEEQRVAREAWEAEERRRYEEEQQQQQQRQQWEDQQRYEEETRQWEAEQQRQHEHQQQYDQYDQHQHQHQQQYGYGQQQHQQQYHYDDQQQQHQYHHHDAHRDAQHAAQYDAGWHQDQAHAQYAHDHRQHQPVEQAAQQWYDADPSVVYQQEHAAHHHHQQPASAAASPNPYGDHSASPTVNDHDDKNWLNYPPAAETASATKRRTHFRTDTLASSVGGLAYDDAPASPASPAQSSDHETPVFKGSALRTESTYLGVPPGSGSGSGSGSPGLGNSRDTIYEDDFEEDDEDAELTINLSRYTHYDGPSDSPTLGSGGPGAWSGARKSLFRATTYQPLPKARCADCGEELDFDELGQHACEQASLPGTPTMPLTPLTPLTPADGQGLTHGLGLGVGVGLGVYKLGGGGGGGGVVGSGLSLSPPRAGGLLATVTATRSRSATTDEWAQSREAGRKSLGLGLREDHLVRSNTSPFTSPTLDGDGEAAAAERRRQIEAQREAKRRLASIDSTTGANGTNAAGAVPPRKVSASSGSSRSSALTEASSLLQHGSPPVSVAITPSTSYDRFSADEDGGPGGPGGPGAEKPRKQRDLLSPTISSTAVWGRMSPVERSTTIAEARKQRQKEQQAMWARVEAEATSKGGRKAGAKGATKLTTAAAAAAAAPTAVAMTRAKTASPSPSKVGLDFDLAGIEDLMKDLQTSSSKDSAQSKPRSARTRTRSGSSPAEVARPSGRERDRERERERDRDRDRDRERERRRDPFTTPPSSSALRSKPKPQPLRGAAAPRKTKLCCVCMCSLGSSRSSSGERKKPTPSVEKDGKLFCAEDYKQLFLPKCTKCRHPVEKDAVKSSDGALKGIFHRGCFCCFRCDARFDTGIFYVFENAPYCFEHYSALAGTMCAACGQGIEGLCRQVPAADADGDAAGGGGGGGKGAGGRTKSSRRGARPPPLEERYHPSCLTCQFEDVRSREFCRDPLDDFWVVGGRRLCEHHATVVQGMLARAATGKKRSAKGAGAGAGAGAGVGEVGVERRRTLLRKVR